MDYRRIVIKLGTYPIDIAFQTVLFLKEDLASKKRNRLFLVNYNDSF